MTLKMNVIFMEYKILLLQHFATVINQVEIMLF